ncbi:MAG: Na/Pi cotransporter family protein [Bacillota bacterium]
MGMFLAILGGIGLFLLGMQMMTGSLKELTGEFIKGWMNRFAGGTGRAIFSGAVITAVIQSSTAVTLLTIGFVSAGLLSFAQSVGVIMGANIGSTSTGWLVSLLGFKVDLQGWALPIIGFGVLLKTFLPQRIAAYGSVLAGFGLLFLGIGVLQEGMAELQHAASFAGLTNIFLLVFIGAIMTIIMQSSSAAVATTLTALFSGVIEFEQAAYLVIGQNIGTTLTAILAAIGAGTAAKRAGMTHVLFNIGTALLAMLLTPQLLQVTSLISHLLFEEFDAAFGIAIFHTLFNVLGVLVFALLMRPFIKLIEKLVPEKGNPFVRHLNPQVAKLPQVALEAVHQTIQLILSELMELMQVVLRDGTVDRRKVDTLHDAAMELRTFLDRIQSMPQEAFQRHVQILHTLDHVDRLLQVIEEPIGREAHLVHPNTSGKWMPLLDKAKVEITEDKQLPELVHEFNAASEEMAVERKARRNEYYVRAAKNEAELATVLKKVDALLWFDRLIYHAWRAIARLEKAQRT